MVERGQVKFVLKAVFFSVLIILYYFMFMEKALEQYSNKRTTIAQMQEEITEPETPIFVICPDPPFKNSYFSEIGMNNTGAERYFWVLPIQEQQIFGHNSPEASDTFMNMSYKLGTDWQINLFHVEG